MFKPRRCLRGARKAEEQSAEADFLPFQPRFQPAADPGGRDIAFEQGFTAFGSTTMMRTALGRLLVTSRVSRNVYGFAKAAAFSLLILAYADGIGGAAQAVLAPVGLACVYLAVVLCVVRGVPVLMETQRLLGRAG